MHELIVRSLVNRLGTNLAKLFTMNAAQAKAVTSFLAGLDFHTARKFAAGWGEESLVREQPYRNPADRRINEAETCIAKL